METLCQSELGVMTNDSDSEWEDIEDEEEELGYYKMIFVVNNEHKMGAGKVAAQVGHATLGLYRILQKNPKKYQSSLEEWQDVGETMITLKAPRTEELLELQVSAVKKNLPCYLVKDAGRTQIPSGSTTVLAIFGDELVLDEITGHLKLF